MKINKTAVILSGGKSSRMNYNNKAFLNINNKSFIEIIIKALEDFEELIISCNDFSKYENELNKSRILSSCKIRFIEDVLKNKGPIGGIYSALINCKFQYGLFVAVDMPLLNKGLLNKIGNKSFKGDALIPIVNGEEQPLCGVYAKSCIATIEEMIHRENYKLKDLLKNINTKYIEVNEELSFSNINTIEEYETLNSRRD